ncbi:cytochrome c-type biogenesis protein [Jannaschia donghaensis]|uniref:Cytochrome c-type biogenesis protein n=1 Tax=Jannaschia donghaensis TaxID=420998 RepID=A0A0M6YKN1_9RHOB|nr:cytochrome c-type biogenesis protein [Jannaschia donghaensis]CTQ50922.1 Cytochrome c-type biogenesis protein CcmH precursor [Jannaschia donghaensis]
MRAALFAAFVMLASPALAVEPGEILADPVLEERARDLSKGLRCLVCRNESIDESSAELARELRVLVRERLVAGDTDAQVIDFLVARYGEYVLLNPTTGGSNMILWIAPLVLLLLGGTVAVVAITRQRAPGETLNAAEEAQLKALMDDESKG